MHNIFIKEDNIYKLRNETRWETGAVKSVYHGTESLTWDMLPTVIKNYESLREFVFKVKKWKPQGCKCRLCKTYITNLGFL